MICFVMFARLTASLYMPKDIGIQIAGCSILFRGVDGDTADPTIILKEYNPG